MTTDTSGNDWFTPVSDIAPMVDKARQAAATRRTHNLEWRKQQIRGVLRLLKDNHSSIVKALHGDLGQSEQYVEIFELATCINMANFALDNMYDWARTHRVPTPFPTNLSQPVHSEITSYPLGVVLIISPWNFPLSLVLSPLVNALSAGNACVIKPSELSTHTSRLLVRLVPRYLDPEAVQMVAGSVDQATELLRHRFDAIAYTGGTRVAKVVARAAAEHLTPCLMELGGKSPAFICDDADVKSAASRIVWGKFAGNMGQFCINTDYCLVVEELKDEFVSEIKRLLLDFYGEDPRRSKDVGRMISVEHAKRVVGLVDGSCEILHGGTRHDVEDRYVEPTIVEANAESKIMSEEIFGPILAIVPVPNVDAAIKFVNDNFNAKGAHPLNLYVFAKSKINQRKVMDNVLSGMCTVNHVIMNGGNFYLPFGGVGNSGMGSYYGKFGFDFFSHKRGALLINNFSSTRADPANWIIFPPYNDTKLATFRFMAKVPGALSQIARLFKLASPVIVGIILHRNPGLVGALCEFNINTIIAWTKSLFGN